MLAPKKSQEQQSYPQMKEKSGVGWSRGWDIETKEPLIPVHEAFFEVSKQA